MLLLLHQLLTIPAQTVLAGQQQAFDHHAVFPRDAMTHAGQQHPQRAPGAAKSVTPINCPSGSVQTLSNGTILDQVTAGSTYVLNPGIYHIRSTVLLNTADTTCFTGSSRDSVTVYVETGKDSDTGRAFKVTNGAKLGLYSLVLDGQDTAPGVYLSDSRTVLDASDITIRKCRFTVGSKLGGDWGGAAVAAWSDAHVLIRSSDLVDSNCTDCVGGALALVGAEGQLHEVCAVVVACCWYALVSASGLPCTTHQNMYTGASCKCHWLAATQSLCDGRSSSIAAAALCSAQTQPISCSRCTMLATMLHISDVLLPFNNELLSTATSASAVATNDD